MSTQKTIEDLQAAGQLVTVFKPHMIIYSHGFGSEKTGGGIFTDIIAGLPAQFGYALFDYYDQQPDGVYISSFSEQVARLKMVAAWISSQDGVKKLSLISHSMGCVITTLANITELSTVIMLAPPLEFSGRTRAVFTKRDGAKRDGDIWHIPRRNGTTSVMPEELFEEIEATDPSLEITSFAAKRMVTVINASDDELLKDVDYKELAKEKGIQVITIDGADHNFTGMYRLQLVQKTRELLDV